jgi:hypothetical protein
MLRIVLKVLRFLIKHINGFKLEEEIEREIQRLRDSKQIVYEAW